MNISIVIPAFNEEQRIAQMLQAYGQFYHHLSKDHDVNVHFVIVLNGCTDKTADIVLQTAATLTDIPVHMIELAIAGKGRAIKKGFEYCLSLDAELIGFVDADMATTPRFFHALVEQLGSCDGIIASRYMQGSQVTPPRPVMKRYGSKFIYEPIIYLLFGLTYHDYQCGAKLFRRTVIEKITPYITVNSWAFDVELLYLCNIFFFKIKEVPTVWHDRRQSKLHTMRNGLSMLVALFFIRMRHRKVR